jgi:DNA invertase Pin-like site-specific DNA recombinase
MFRSAVDALDVLGHFKERGMRLHVIDLGGDVTFKGGNAVSKLTFTILAAVAEAERDRIRERITEEKRSAPARPSPGRQGAVRLLPGRGRHVGVRCPHSRGDQRAKKLHARRLRLQSIGDDLAKR